MSALDNMTIVHWEHERREQNQPDISIECQGSIDLFRPLTRAGREWITANISEDSNWFGGALVVEPRYAANLITGMTNDGLILR